MGKQKLSLIDASWRGEDFEKFYQVRYLYALSPSYALRLNFYGKQFQTHGLLIDLVRVCCQDTYPWENLCAHGSHGESLAQAVPFGDHSFSFLPLGKPATEYSDELAMFRVLEARMVCWLDGLGENPMDAPVKAVELQKTLMRLWRKFLREHENQTGPLQTLVKQKAQQERPFPSPVDFS